METSSADTGQALFDAVKARDVAAVGDLLKAGTDPNADGALGDSVLHLAVEKHQQQIARLLLEHGADPNSEPGREGPVSVAARTAQPAMLELLLDKGGDNFGLTSLHWAVHWSRQTAEQPTRHRVRRHGPARPRAGLVPVDSRARHPRSLTPPKAEAEEGRADVVRVLLETSANPRERNAMGLTAAWEAGVKDHDELAAMLIEAERGWETSRSLHHTKGTGRGTAGSRRQANSERSNPPPGMR